MGLLIVFAVIAVFVIITVMDSKYNGDNDSQLTMGIESNPTQYNPATGLPMIGALDSMGNSIGSSASDRDNNWHNDYHRSAYNSSSYDPFNNRY